MTWKEFKEKVEALGVKDETAIGYIDVMVDESNPEIKIGWVNGGSKADIFN